MVEQAQDNILLHLKELERQLDAEFGEEAEEEDGQM